MDTTWHIWAIKAGSFEKIKRYFEESVPEVIEYMYPRVKKERIRKDRVIIKNEALYMNYLFIHLRDEDYPYVFEKFRKCPVITTYVGPCFDEDLERVRKVKELEDKRSREVHFFRGDKVRVVSGPFRERVGVVDEVRKNVVVLRMDFLGKETRTEVSPERLDYV